MGSGGSAVSFGFAAGFAAGAGGLAGAAAPVLAAGGAGVLPSTGSAIFPLSDLSMNYESSIVEQTHLTRILETTSYISASPYLSSRIQIWQRSCHLGWFVLWTADQTGIQFGLCSSDSYGLERRRMDRISGETIQRVFSNLKWQMIIATVPSSRAKMLPSRLTKKNMRLGRKLETKR